MMPLLTELAETVVGCGSYKHAAPTELVLSRRPRSYKLSVISVISCSNPSQIESLQCVTRSRDRHLGAGGK